MKKGVALHMHIMRRHTTTGQKQAVHQNHYATEFFRPKLHDMEIEVLDQNFLPNFSDQN